MFDSKRSVLLVDDEQRDLETICDVLETAGYKVCNAGSYTEALECVNNLHVIPDLLVSDIALPKVNGIELYRKLSTMTGVWLNVLFISAYSGAEILRFYNLPMSDVHFLPKPFSAEDLLRRVGSLIERPVPLPLAS